MELATVSQDLKGVMAAVYENITVAINSNHKNKGKILLISSKVINSTSLAKINQNLVGITKQLRL